MTPSRKHLVIAGVSVAALGLSFAGGRWSKQGSRQEESKTEAKAEVMYASHSAADLSDKGTKRTRTVKVERKEPTGAVTTTTTTDTLKSADLTLHLDAVESGSGSESVKSEQKVTVASRSNWAIGVAAEWSLKNPTPRPEAYAASLEYRLLGPVWLKAEASTEKTVGVGARLEF